MSLDDLFNIELIVAMLTLGGVVSITGFVFFMFVMSLLED